MGAAPDDQDVLVQPVPRLADVEVRVAADGVANRDKELHRNRGWRRARAPIVAFTDDDTVPARDWLERGLEALEDHVDAASGRIVRTPCSMRRNSSGLAQTTAVSPSRARYMYGDGLRALSRRYTSKGAASVSTTRS